MMQASSNLLRLRQSVENHNPYSLWAIGAVLFLVAIIVYSPSLKTNFVWDADVIYTKYSAVQDLGNLRNVFSTEVVTNEDNIGGSEVVAGVHYYRPLTKAYFIIARAVFGVSPVGYKVASLLLHATAVILAFFLIVSISSQPAVAALAALLFAVNPIHSEAVVWTYSVSYLLVAVFSLATILLYRRRCLVLSLLTFTAALLSHEMGVLLMPILIIHKWLLEDSGTWKDYVSLAPYVILLIAFLILRASIVGGIPVSNVEPAIFLNTVVVIVQSFVRIFFWPDSAVTIYVQEEFSTISPELIASYLVCAGLMVLAYVFWKRDRQSLFWLLWFGAWISVSLNVGKLGEYLMAEKILYTASIGICALLARWAGRLSVRRSQIAILSLLLFACVQVYQTWKRIPYWQDTSTYLVAALDHAPEFYLAHHALMDTYVKKQQYAQARHHAEQVVRLKPTFTPGLNSLANLNYMAGDLHQAIAYWEKALSVDPNYALPYFNIGLSLRQLGKVDESMQYFQEYVRLVPNPPPAVRDRLRTFGMDLGQGG
jgi:hypothetical protein